MEQRLLRGSVLSVLTAAACHAQGTQPSSPVRVVTAPNVELDPLGNSALLRLPSVQYTYSDPSLAEVVNATNAILSQSDFQTFVGQVKELSNGDNNVVGGANVLANYLNPKLLPSTRLIKTLRNRWYKPWVWFANEVARTNLATNSATVYLHPIVMRRWRSSSIEAKACAVNTIAHEWTHTVQSAAGTGLFAYVDKGHATAKTPLVSYTLGAIAQCAYLKSNASNGSEIDMQTCVNAVGTTTFNASSCNAGWSQALAKRNASPLLSVPQEDIDDDEAQVAPARYWKSVDLLCAEVSAAPEIIKDGERLNEQRALAGEMLRQNETLLADNQVKLSLIKISKSKNVIAETSELQTAIDELRKALVENRKHIAEIDGQLESLAKLQTRGGELSNAGVAEYCKTTNLDALRVDDVELLALAEKHPSYDAVLEAVSPPNADEDSISALSAALKSPSSMVPGASLQTTIVTALVGVISDRARTEVEIFAVQTIAEIACVPSRQSWFTQSCAFLKTDDDELPITFGVGLRSALMLDLAAVPEKVGLLKHTGSAQQLLAALFVTASQQLVRRAELASMVEALDVVQKNFTCRNQDQTCEQTKLALGYGSAVLSAVANGVSDQSALAAHLNQIASNSGITLTDTEIAALRTLAERAITAAQDLAKSINTATRPQLIRAFVDATTALVNEALHQAKAEQLPPGLADLIIGIANGDARAIITATVSVFRTLPKMDTLLDGKALRLLSFAAEIAEAKDTKQAAAAIEAVIAPIGSYRMKRRNTMFSVGALVGGATGKEFLRKSDGTTVSGWTAAPAALVGIDLSLPMTKHCGLSTAFPHAGIFASVIDLGSALSWRFDAKGEQDKDVSQSTSVGFAQLFSPGLYFRLGLGKSPFILGAGMSWTPHARSITDATGEIEQPSAMRLSAFVAVDVPLLPFRF
jgi:hypothetical protein